MSKNKNTVHVIDDDESVLVYLSEILSRDNLSVQTYKSADDFFNNFNHSGNGCLIIDLRLPDISGLELQQKLASKNIDLPFIMITGHADVTAAVTAMKAGAIDFIEKPFSTELFLERVHSAIDKHKKCREHSEQQQQILDCINSLTNREKEVMCLVVDGHQNKDIASQLNISIKTVEAHRSNVMEKMKANTVVDLVRMSMALGKPVN